MNIALIGVSGATSGPGCSTSCSGGVFAIAMVDELESPKRFRQRFTVGYSVARAPRPCST